MLVSVSFLKNNKGNRETILSIDKSNCDYIHVDIMDGKFAGTKNFTTQDIKDLFEGIKKPLDIHLMVENPFEYIKELVSLKPKYITIHSEIKNDIKKCINYLKENTVGVGLALNPSTRVYNILPYIKDIDLVLVMGVVPGLGGQEFIRSNINKINELKALQVKYNYIINVDGGVNDKTISMINSDMVVSGSFVVLSDNYNEKIKILKNSK